MSIDFISFQVLFVLLLDSNTLYESKEVVRTLGGTLWGSGHTTCVSGTFTLYEPSSVGVMVPSGR